MTEGGELSLEFAIVEKGRSAKWSKQPLWLAEGGTNNSWKQASVFVGKRARNVTLQFTAYLTNVDLFPMPAIAVDDISYVDCAYLDQSADAASLNCNFSAGWCGWYPETTFDNTLVLQSGHAYRAASGPSTDADGQTNGM